MALMVYDPSPRETDLFAYSPRAPVLGACTGLVIITFESREDVC